MGVMTPSIPRQLTVQAALIAAAVSASGCFLVSRVSVRSLDRAPVSVRTPVRVHLVDGSTVVFREGAVVSQAAVTGRGMRFGLTLDSSAESSVPMADVLGMETFVSYVDPGASIGVSVLATAAVLVGTVVIACINDPKCFGSCPTIYADSAGVAVLQAEGFSYSIAPLFEMRDVDPLRVRADASGAVALEVRNEALETHYINHLELLDIRHRPGETVVPDPRGVPVALAGLTAPMNVTDRAGRDVRGVLAAHDGDAYRTDPGVLNRASGADHDDWIVLEMPAPSDADSVAILFRLRNSLLTTVLFYDVMLGDRGARALTYVADDLSRIGPAVDLGRWYGETMGMHVAVQDGGRWRQVGRFLDTGPVAWKELAVVVPVPRGSPTLRVRLSFVADDWRIDRLAVAASFRRPSARTVPLARVIDSDGHADSSALDNMRSADERYLQTTASQRFQAVFEAGTGPADSARTFFLASQGYYTEWIRQGWITQAHESSPFSPRDDAIDEALRRWRGNQATYERQFAATRVPVR